MLLYKLFILYMLTNYFYENLFVYFRIKILLLSYHFDNFLCIFIILIYSKQKPSTELPGSHSGFPHQLGIPNLEPSGN